MKHLFTVEEAAQSLSLGKSKLYELLAAGVIESVHIGSARRIPAEALENYVARLRAQAAEHTAA